MIPNDVLLSVNLRIICKVFKIPKKSRAFSKSQDNRFIRRYTSGTSAVRIIRRYNSGTTASSLNLINPAARPIASNALSPLGFFSLQLSSSSKPPRNSTDSLGESSSSLFLSSPVLSSFKSQGKTSVDSCFTANRSTRGRFRVFENAVVFWLSGVENLDILMLCENCAASACIHSTKIASKIKIFKTLERASGQSDVPVHERGTTAVRMFRPHNGGWSDYPDRARVCQIFSIQFNPIWLFGFS